jgi:hypothetical protein
VGTHTPLGRWIVVLKAEPLAYGFKTDENNSLFAL